MTSSACSDVDVADFNGKSLYMRRVVFGVIFWEQDRVYGSLELRLVDESGTVEISPDLYNFDQKPDDGFLTRFRNMATKRGSNRAGEGVPFEIVFRGTNHID